jgi:hypothetical protein
MKFLSIALLVPLLSTIGCVRRGYNTLNSKDVADKAELATVVVESTSVRQLVRVIGIEKDEAHCLGGNPKHVFLVKNTEKIEIEMPVTVTQIGLCGQATPTGLEHKLIPVALKKGQKVVIKDDVATLPIAEGFARVRIESTKVRQLVRVIGIEKEEAACVGGNPKYVTTETDKLPIEIDLPISVTKIGLCGQATSVGMDYKHIPVTLKEGEILTLVDDKLK